MSAPTSTEAFPSSFSHHFGDQVFFLLFFHCGTTFFTSTSLRVRRVFAALLYHFCMFCSRFAIFSYVHFVCYEHFCSLYARRMGFTFPSIRFHAGTFLGWMCCTRTGGCGDPQQDADVYEGLTRVRSAHHAGQAARLVQAMQDRKSKPRLAMFLQTTCYRYLNDLCNVMTLFR